MSGLTLEEALRLSMERERATRLPERNGTVPHPDAGIDEPAEPMPQDWPDDSASTQDTRDGPRRYKLYRASDIVKLPPPAPLVDGLLWRDTVAVIVATWASFKSTLLVDLALSVASGTPWHGRQVEPGPVVFIVTEAPAGIGMRAQAWSIARGVPLPERAYFILVVPNLFDEADVITLEATLAEMAVRPSFVVVDGVARASVGADENSARDMGKVIEAVDRLRRLTGACVALVHHTPKNGEGARGHGSLTAAADVELRLARDGDRVTITAAKTKDAAEPEPLTLVKRVVELPGGATSVVLDRDTSGAGPVSATSPLDRKALDVLGRHGPMTTAEWQRAAESEGIARRSFYEARNRLMAAGRAISDTPGQRGAPYRVAGSMQGAGRCETVRTAPSPGVGAKVRPLKGDAPSPAPIPTLSDSAGDGQPDEVAQAALSAWEAMADEDESSRYPL